MLLDSLPPSAKLSAIRELDMPLNDQCEHFAFAVGQRVEPAGAPLTCHQPARDC
jgi:hypothetical protein